MDYKKVKKELIRLMNANYRYWYNSGMKHKTQNISNFMDYAYLTEIGSY